MDIQGLLLCAKYAASPNFLGYCGPASSASLTDHLKENMADREVTKLLSEFETLFPYLSLIARENHIADPFARDVVEAYWLGNNLLQHISAREAYALLQEKLLIERVLEAKQLFKTKRKIFTLHYLPHHTFHVLNIFKRTGKAMGVHSLETMDACRIGWGKVTKIIPTAGKSEETLLVKTQPLRINKGKIILDTPVMRNVGHGYQRKKFLSNIRVGDWVSYHWSYLCDRLSPKQLRNLVFYTRQSIDYYNSL